MTIFLTILATCLAIFSIQRFAVWFADQHYETNSLLERLADEAYGLCDRLGWAIPNKEPALREGLDRYPEDGSNPMIPFITRIVVPSEYAREQVVRAIRYLHDQDIDTEYMAVNNIVHCYTGYDGEPTDHPPMIVVEP